MSADTIVPDPTDPQSYNRYAYARNNPIKYFDPDGHFPIPPSPICLKCIMQPFEELTNAAIIQVFKMAYDHDLPKQFIDHYAYGEGAPIHLEEAEMVELGVNIDLGARAEFNDQIIQIAQNGGGTAHVSFSTFEAATTHGTLGNFTANYEGDLSVTVNDSGNVTGWSFDGSVNFFDDWNFDPRPRGERSTYAEILTRVGDAFLPGESFAITSDSVPLVQTHLLTEAIWAGTGVEGVPSLLADELTNN